MRMFNKIATVAAVVSAIALVGAADAAVNFNFTPGSSVASGATIIQNFNGASVSGLSGTAGVDYVLHAGGAANNDNTGAAPNSGTSQYLAVLGGRAVTYTLATAVQALQFDWGTASIDNVLTVYTTDNAAGQTYTVTGSDIPNGPLYNKNGLLTAISTTGKITGIKLAAGSNSFEVDNLAAAVPEPASWAMMIGGFGLVGASMRRRGAATVRFA